MQRELNFPIKGTFYYSADLAIEMGLLKEHSILHFVLEPDNIHDIYAMQIWLDIQHSGNLKSKEYLIGYVPKILSKPLNKLLESYEVTGLKVSHLAKHDQFIEVDCKLIIQQPLIKYIYLLSLAKLSQQSQFLKRLRRRWYTTK